MCNWLAPRASNTWRASRWQARAEPFSEDGMVPVILVFAFAVTVCRYRLQDSPGEEPFALLEGISIWPGDFLRLSVALLAVHFACRTLYDLCRNGRELELELAMADPAAAPLRETRGWAPLRWWRNFWPQTEDYTTREHRVDVRALWLRYKNWMESHKRLGRALLLLVLYVAGAWCFLGSISDPASNLPVRGSAGNTSKWILLAGWYGTLFITFLVVDATELNWRSIRDLNRHPTDWHLPAAVRTPGKSPPTGGRSKPWTTRRPRRSSPTGENWKRWISPTTWTWN